MTTIFGCDQRISKSSAIAEALGALDEINSFLGLCKVHKESASLKLSAVSFSEIIQDVQQNLFIIQAEIAGSKKTIEKNKIKEIEKIIDEIEKTLPLIKTFFISGGTELSALFDVARTIARRAERRAVEVSEEGKQKISENSLAYLNRLSSLLYALARLTNHKSDITEQIPDYH
ncbi:MAG: ATP/cobalamin adenosyltransferase [Parcubacteria group bacterium]|nr:ATP/cobalamin adenosyltransferase [Parcubacteria group bacterium]